MREEGRIDVHAHHLPPAYREAVETAGLAMPGGLPFPPWTAELALKFMDDHGIERQVLSISDPGVDFLAAGEAQALARRCNDELAATIASHPTRFAGFGVVSMKDPDVAAAEVAHALDELGLAGIGLFSSSAGLYLGDPHFDTVLGALDRRSAWVFVHPIAVAADEKPSLRIPDFLTEFPFDTTRAIVSLLTHDAFARFPGIRWHFAHGGGTIPMLRNRLNVAVTHAKLLAPILGLPDAAAGLEPHSAEAALAGSYYDTALVAERPSLEAVAGISGPDRILFGSDWPFAGLAYPPEGDPQPAIGEVFAPEERRAIERHNAATLLA